MDKRLERLEQWIQGIPAPPIRIEAELTDRCNLSCVFCWKQNQIFARSIQAREHPGKGELSDDRWLQIVEEAKALGVEEWHVCGGGEPFVRYELALKLMQRIKKTEMMGILTTNGTLIDENAANQIVAMHWDVVEVSMESPHPYPNDYLRGRGAFARAHQALKLIQHRKQQTGSDTPRTQIAAVLSNKNFRLLPQLIQFTALLGAEKFSVNPLHSPPGSHPVGQKQRMSESDLKELPGFIHAAVMAAQKYKIETNVGDYLEQCYIEKADHFDELIEDQYPEGSSHPFCNPHCYVSWFTVAIRPDGMVGPCVAFKYGEGEAIHTKSLETIWTGDYFTSIRQRLLERNPPDVCARCCAPFFVDGATMRRLIHEKVHP